MTRPFYSTRLESDRAKDKEIVLTVKLNQAEQELLAEGMRLMQQEKESTALKMLAKIGLEVLRDPKTRLVLETILGNLRRNERLGIVGVEPGIGQK